MITTLFQQLPDIYRALLPDIFSRDIPIELYADCQNCNMCKPNAIASNQLFFSEKTKCCTFHPIIPNYLVGCILAESEKTLIHDAAKNGTNITPLGYFPSTQDLRHYASIIPDQFGIDESAMCHFLDNGNCSIWKYRNSICSTYFCRYAKGHHGKRFWEDVRDFLQFVECMISEHCCYLLGIPVDYLKNATTNFFINVQESLQDNNKKQLPDDAMWGKWAVNKPQFFNECRSICKQLTLSAIQNLHPTQYHIKLTALEKSFNRMMRPKLPSKLKFNSKCKIIEWDDTHTFFQTNHLMKLPSILKDILPLFDGATSNDSIMQLASETFEVEMDSHYLAHLYEQEILVGV